MEGVEEVFKMKKKEIQEIYDLFITCLPKNCTKPKGIKIYSSWKKMVEEAWGDWIRDLVERDCGVKLGKLDIIKLDLRKNFYRKSLDNVYPYSTRIEKIHDFISIKSSTSIGGFADVGSGIILIYSRGIARNVIDLLSKLLHETGHLNVGEEENRIDSELEVERWMWKRWPYVYGHYKKLKI